MLQQRLGSSAQTRDVVTGLINRIACAGAFAANLLDCGAARPVLHHSRRGWHSPQHPGEVPAAFAFTLAGLPRCLTAMYEPITEQLKALAKTVLYSVQEVGATLFEVGKKGNLHAARRAAPASR